MGFVSISMKWGLPQSVFLVNVSMMDRKMQMNLVFIAAICAADGLHSMRKSLHSMRKRFHSMRIMSHSMRKPISFTHSLGVIRYSLTLNRCLLWVSSMPLDNDNRYPLPSIHILAVISSREQGDWAAMTFVWHDKAWLFESPVRIYLKIRMIK